MLANKLKLKRQATAHQKYLFMARLHTQKSKTVFFLVFILCVHRSLQNFKITSIYTSKLLFFNFIFLKLLQQKIRKEVIPQHSSLALKNFFNVKL